MMKKHLKNVLFCVLMTSFFVTSSLAYAGTQYSLLHSIEGPQGIFIFEGFSPDGQRLLTTANDLTTIFDVHTGKQVLSIDMPRDSHRSPAYSPDSRYLIGASLNNTAKVWDANTGKELLTLTGHGNRVADAQYLPSGNVLFTSDSDGIAKTWDAKTGKEIATMKAGWPTVFSLNGRLIATGIFTDKESVHPDMNKSIHVFDARTGKEVFMLTNRVSGLMSMDFSPDARHIVTGAKGEEPETVTAKIWDVETGELIHTLKRDAYFVHTVGYSKNGLCIYSTLRNEETLVWDAQTGDLLENTTICDDAANPQYTTDTKMLKELATQGGLKFVQSWAFSPDKQYLVIGSNSKVTIWKVK